MVGTHGLKFLTTSLICKLLIDRWHHCCKPASQSEMKMKITDRQMAPMLQANIGNIKSKCFLTDGATSALKISNTHKS